MLMLTRRRGECIDVYDVDGTVVITIKVSEFLPNNVVRLGIEADKERYTILRDNAKERTAPSGDNPRIRYRRRPRPG